MSYKDEGSRKSYKSFYNVEMHTIELLKLQKNFQVVMKYLILILLNLIIIIYSNIMLYGVDFGVRGMVFDVVEDDLIEILKEKAKKIDIKLLEKKWRNKVKYQSDNPNAVQGLGKAIKTNIREYEPITKLDQDILSNRGELLYKKGFQFNILNYTNIDLSYKKYLFIDGKDNQERKWLKKYLLMIEKNHLEECKVIFTAGKISELSKEFEGIKIFFDQSAWLTKIFNVKNTPSIIKIKGNKIQIKELAL